MLEKSKIVLNWALTGLLSALSVLVLTIAVELPRLSDHIQVETTRWRTDTQNELHATRQELLTKVDDIRGDFRYFVSRTDTRISSIERNLFQEVAAIRQDTFTRVDSIHNELIPVRDSALVLAKTYNDIPKVVGERLDPWTDCKANGLCWQGQLSDTLFAVRTSSRAVGENAGVVASNFTTLSNNFAIASGVFTRDFPVITSNLSSTAQNINTMTKPKWYDRLITYGATGSLLYFNIVGGKRLTNIK